MFGTMVSRFGGVCGLVLVLGGVCVAEVRLPAVFADNMVLQRNQPIRIWGWAQPGENVTVALAGHSTTATTEQDGRWRAALGKLSARAKPLDMRVRDSSGGETVIHNILIGDVWHCTGPSNIFWPVKKCDNAKQEIAAATFPEIRFFMVKRQTADEPQADCQGKWAVCSPKTVGEVSGIGYFFARRIHKDVDVPVGMLQTFWGGSRIEAWTSRQALESTPALKPILDWWENSIKAFDPDQAQADYKRKRKRWKHLATQAKADGKKPPAKPRKPEDPRSSRHRPASLYNGMIAPLIPFGIRGVISYQGLGNLVWADYNRVLLSTLIRDWRSRWKQGPFPFGMVQPAPYPCDRRAKQHDDASAVQREAQLLMLDELENTGVAPAMDIGDLEELHFTNKQDPGRRIAQWALATVYGRPVPYAGPVYQSMTVENDKIRIRFNHTGKGLSTRDGASPTHFTIAGVDKTFHRAEAVIDGHTVIVHAKQVAHPTVVRFAWSDTAIPNLVNSHGLPASLFRTDVPSRDDQPLKKK